MRWRLAEALLVRYGEFVFRYRNVLFPAVIATLVLSFPPYPGSERTLDLELLGFAIAGLGQALRALVVGLAYIKRGGVNKRIYADSLVTEGLFAHCRNPLYAGNILMFLGLFMIYNHPAVYLLGGLFVLSSYAAVVAAEERYLEGRFGPAFREYCVSVPRWIPNLRGLRETLLGMRFNWRRVLIKEYASAASWLLTACTLLAYESIRSPRASATDAATLRASIGVAIIVVALTTLVWRLKKSGRLRATGV